ncbi:MAG: ABC transporter ATP-binding protein [Candidatus Thermoplasmatota archaeon]|nr:ABC transporter ATP-binding protein [Candidatus Thermoplasmatota archaeon]MCL5730771.1 ABC transporter ATP-binding protein [Candidatus Thermoplasmatota archaeon]
MSSFLEVRDLNKKYDDSFSLRSINLSLEKGEILTLMGPSGSGKTSLIRNICGLEMPDSGSVFIGGMDVTDLPPGRRGTGIIFQDLALFPHMTAFENIAYGLRARRMENREVERMVRDISATLHIDHILEKYPDRISGGERQRVALARSIIVSPSVILMDEPLSSLDPELRLEVRKDIRRISKNMGLTMIYVTHYIEEGLYMGDRVSVIMEGRILADSNSETLFSHPPDSRVAAFLGYNVIRGTDGNIFAVHPSEISIGTNSTEMIGTVDSIGYEGEFFRISVSYRGEEIEIRSRDWKMCKGMKNGDRISFSFNSTVKLKQ